MDNIYGFCETKTKCGQNSRQFAFWNMKVKPLGDRVIIKPISEDITSKAGIVLPETVEKERAEKGEVMAVGPGRLLDNGQLVPMSVKVGDKVMFKKYSPDEIKVDNEEYLVISDDDIFVVFE